jgi:hypothetical protein
VKSKVILVVIASFIFCIKTYSQILVGPVAGANYSWVSYSKINQSGNYKSSGVFGYHIGAQGTFKVRNRFFLHSSILYSTKGKDVNSKDSDYHVTATYSFIDVPLIYAIDFMGSTKGGKQFKYFLGVGPNVSYWLGGSGKFSNVETIETIYTPTINYSIAFKKNIDELPYNKMNVGTPNRIQLGLVFETGIQFEPQPRQRIKFSLRYELGHSNLSKDSDGQLPGILGTDELQANNQGFRFSVAYLYDTKISDRKKGKSATQTNTRAGTNKKAKSIQKRKR